MKKESSYRGGLFEEVMALDIKTKNQMVKSCPFAEDEDFLGLTIIQQRFILAYGFRDIRGWTWDQCYEFAAGKIKSRRNGNVSAYRMMNHPKVKPFLKKWDRILVEQFSQESDRIWQEEQSIAYSDIINYLDEYGTISYENLRRLPRSVTAAIQSLEVIEQLDGSTRYKIKLWDKSAALARMQRMKGMNAPEEINLHAKLLSASGDLDEAAAAQLYADLIKGNVNPEDDPE